MTHVAVITVVHGRHDHLMSQLAAARRSTFAPTTWIIVAMDDPGIDELVSGVDPRVQIVRTPSSAAALPVARARNLGAARALALGAEVLVFLDVDCLPSPDAIGAYAVAAIDPATADRLLCGPVTYLPPPTADSYPLDRLDEFDNPHPARPAPPPGTIQLGGPHELFWSLSFATHARVWYRIGGFCEIYSGYGGEDTDFAFSARRRGVDLAWIGSARAYHQYHPVHSPPVEHLADIVRNARLFHQRWGSWPMRGWLDAFERDGLIRNDPDGYTIVAPRQLQIGQIGRVVENAVRR